MKIVVLVKRVPDTESKIRIQHETQSIIEEGLNFVINPYDEYAVEEALRLREAKEGSVHAVSVGPEETVPVLRKCLAMGADDATLIKDEAGETYDGLRTAKIIARAVDQKFPGFDLILFGKQAVGADNSQVPAMVAEILGLPQVNVVTQLDIEENQGTAIREIEGGAEKVEFSLPAVVSAQKGLNEPRYETLKGIMAAKKKDIPVIEIGELGLSAEDLGPKVIVKNLDLPAQRQAGKILEGEPADTARELVALLHNEAKVI